MEIHLSTSCSCCIDGYVWRISLRYLSTIGWWRGMAWGMAWRGMACRVVLSVCQLSWQNYKHYYLVRSSKDDSFAFLPIFCRYLFVRIMRIMMRNAYTKGLHVTYLRVCVCRMRTVYSFAIDIFCGDECFGDRCVCVLALLCMPRENCKTWIHSMPLSVLLMCFFSLTPSSPPKDE